MTRDRKPQKKSARPVSKSDSTARPSGTRAKADGKLHVRPGSVRKPKTDSRPKPASLRNLEARNQQDGQGGAEGAASAPGRTPAGQPSRSTRPAGRTPNPPRQRGPQLDTPPTGAKFRDRDGKVHTFPDSALKRVAAQILTERNKKWRYRPFGFPIFTPSGNEQEMHFDFYVYDNMDSIFKLILLMPRESREVWDRVGRFKQQYPMYSYELWTPDHLARVQGPQGKLGW